MEFYFDNKRHVLRGSHGPKVKTSEESQLSQTMAEACHLCMLQLVPFKDVDEALVMTGAISLYGKKALLLNYLLSSSNLKTYSKTPVDYLLVEGCLITEYPRKGMLNLSMLGLVGIPWNKRTLLKNWSRKCWIMGLFRPIVVHLLFLWC